MERSQKPDSVRAERNSFSSLHRKRYLGSSRSPPQRTSPESCGKNVDQSQHTSRFGKCTSDLEKFRVRLQKRSEGWRPYTFRTKYSVNSHAFVREATLTISVKILPRRLNLPNGSRLYYKTINCEKTSAFCSVTSYHPTVASPKEHLYEQMPSNPAFTERDIQKANPFSYILVLSKTLWSSVTLYRACRSVKVVVCQHFDFKSAHWHSDNLLVSPADICEQWKGNLTARFSRRSWGRNAWRTPGNVCEGGHGFSDVK